MPGVVRHVDGGSHCCRWAEVDRFWFHGQAYLDKFTGLSDLVTLTAKPSR